MSPAGDRRTVPLSPPCHPICRKDGIDYPAEGLRVPGQPELPGEEADALSRSYDEELTPEMAEVLGRIRQKSYAVPEAAGEHLDRVHAMKVHVPEAELVAFARSCGTSPAPLLAIVMADTVFAVHPECDEPKTVLVPFSTRKLIGLPNTFKNTSNAAFIHIDPKERARASPFAENGSGCTRGPAVLHHARACPLHGQRLAPILRGGRQARGIRGKARCPQPHWSLRSAHQRRLRGGLRSEGFEDQIVDVRYLAMPIADVNPGISLFVTATAGVFNLVFVRTMVTDVYDKAFVAKLDKLGISHELGGETMYITPRSGLADALGLD